MAIPNLYFYLSLHLYVFVFVFVFLLLASGGDARSGAWVTSCSLARTSTPGPWFVSKNVSLFVYLLISTTLFPFLLVFLFVFLLVFVFVFVFSFPFLVRASSLEGRSTVGLWFVSKNIFLYLQKCICIYACVFVFVFVFLFRASGKQPCKDVYSRSPLRPAADVSKSIGMTSNWFPFNLHQADVKKMRCISA